MKGIRACLLASLALWALGGAALAEPAAPVPAEVQAAAARGLDQFKAMVGPKAAMVGFADSGEVGRATLGEGFQLHYVDGDRLRSAGGSDSLLALVHPVDAWHFTVDLDGTPKSFLTIAFEDGEYRAVHMGGDAGGYGAALANFRELTAARGVEVDPTLVKIGPALYFVAQLGAEEFVLPAGADWLGEMDDARLWPAGQVVQMLKERQQNDGPGARGGAVGGPSIPVSAADPVDAEAAESPAPSVEVPSRFAAPALGLSIAVIAGAAAVRRRRPGTP